MLPPRTNIGDEDPQASIHPQLETEDDESSMVRIHSHGTMPLGSCLQPCGVPSALQLSPERSIVRADREQAEILAVDSHNSNAFLSGGNVSASQDLRDACANDIWKLQPEEGMAPLSDAGANIPFAHIKHPIWESTQISMHDSVIQPQTSFLLQGTPLRPPPTTMGYGWSYDNLLISTGLLPLNARSPSERMHSSFHEQSHSMDEIWNHNFLPGFQMWQPYDSIRIPTPPTFRESESYGANPDMSYAEFAGESFGPNFIQRLSTYGSCAMPNSRYTSDPFIVEGSQGSPCSCVGLMSSSSCRCSTIGGSPEEFTAASNQVKGIQPSEVDVIIPNITGTCIMRKYSRNLGINALLETAFKPGSTFENASRAKLLELITVSTFLVANQIEPTLDTNEGQSMINMISPLPGYEHISIRNASESIYTVLVDISTRRCLTQEVKYWMIVYGTDHEWPRPQRFCSSALLDSHVQRQIKRFKCTYPGW
ncbi:hypothetical protein M408DRAFT_12730 [Serendipita vermifera MAFF 305830]|uniref:Uncharacterized protein n=1 Tax=Serendipita vermifera MAFF 305830 TaxID=933852 RepID=A0A0C3AM96_SERVB|nr:hypothetical protein M408DRAFT_12730 [Serendipita vermifera MAFF 305830]